MSQSRILTSIAAASLGILLLGACSAESLTERAASFGLEQAIEGDQDIDLDFSDEGGGFSISTDEGEFSLSFDEDNGGIVFNTDEGDGVISFDEDGIVFNTDEGDGVIGFDEDNGRVTFETDAGDGEINFNEEGELTIETDEGNLGIFSSDEVPEAWPAQIGFPATLVPGSQSFSVLNLGDVAVTTGVFNHSPTEPYAKAVAESLIDAGWEIAISNNQDGSYFAQLTNASGVTAQIVSDSTGYTTISLTQNP